MNQKCYTIETPLQSLRQSQRARDNLTDFEIPSVTPGKRLYLIRLACGDGHRTAEPLVKFVARVKRLSGESYDPATISLLERDKQGWRLKDFEALAAADPMKRGAPWLAFGIQALGPVIDARTGAHRLTEEEMDRAVAAGDREEAEEKASRKKGAKKRA